MSYDSKGGKIFDQYGNTEALDISSLYQFDENLSYPLLKNRCKTHKYFCIDCGAPITSSGIRCIECSKIASRIVERPNREELK